MTIRLVNTPAVRVRRWTAAAIVALAVMVWAPQAFSGAQPAVANNADAVGTSDTYVVSQGETLWSIAQSLTPVGHDVRDTVSTITSMNMLDSVTIHPGQQLLVPLAG